jgi:hypothetical protein
MTRINKILNSYKKADTKKETLAEEYERSKKEDNVNHPSHYTQGAIECIDAIKEATKGLFGIEAVCTANIIKYVWRWKFKNGLEDLDKASWYLERLKQEVRNNKK